MIGPHADAAAWFLGAACITAVLSIVALIVGRKRGERPRWLEIVALLLILFSITVVARTALLGGRIHHPEVRAVVRS